MSTATHSTVTKAVISVELSGRALWNEQSSTYTAGTAASCGSLFLEHSEVHITSELFLFKLQILAAESKVVKSRVIFTTTTTHINDHFVALEVAGDLQALVGRSDQRRVLVERLRVEEGRSAKRSVRCE